MSSYTTLVNVDAEAVHKIISCIAQLMPKDEGEAFFEECNAFAEGLDANKLINKLLEKQELIFAMEQTQDIEGLFQAMFSLLYTLGEGNNESPEIVNSIISAIISNQETQTKIRLSVLVILFNLLFVGETKFIVLKAIFDYAKATKQTTLVTHFHTRVEDWIETWHINVESQRILLQMVSAALEQEGQHSLALGLRIKYFSSYKNDESYPAEVEALITTAVLSAIKSPVSSFADRTALLESFNTLKFSAKLLSLVELLRIVCDGSLAEYNAYRQQNATEFSSNNIDADELERNMKLLTLCSLAAQAKDKVVPISTIKEVLNVDDDEVEMWVIDAIAEKLIEASIDQLAGTVTITGYSHRSFGLDHWKGMQQNLLALRHNLAGVIDSITRSKAPTTATTTM